MEDLDFVDDLALLSHSHEQMQAKTTALHNLSTSIGLLIHPAKSKLLRIGTHRKIKVDEQELEGVESFCYPGSTIGNGNVYITQ